MPQLVPGGSPPDYSAVFAADSFDLSLLPESPPAIVKEEPAAWEDLPPGDLEETADLLLASSPRSDISCGGGRSGEGDHRLLRQVLKDTSFQKRYNLVPVPVGELGTGFAMTEQTAASLDLPQDEIEPMLSLAMEQLKSEVQGTCAVLGITRGQYSSQLIFF